MSLLLAASASPLRAASYYTAKTGSNANTGTLAAPFLTIAHGLSRIGAGDVLYVRAGTYAETFASVPSGTSWSAPATLKAYPGEAVIVKPASGANLFKISSAQYFAVDGFVFDGTNVTFCFFLANPGGHIRIQNSEIKNCQATGILVADLSGSNEFINLKIHHNGGTDPKDHGIYIDGDNNLVDHCDIYSNGGYGVSIYNGYAGGTASGNIVRFSRLYNNSYASSPRGGLGMTKGTGNTAYNNLIWGNGGGIMVNSSAIGTRIFNNTIYNNNTGSSSRYGIYLGNADGSANSLVQNNIVFQNSDGNITNASQPGAVIANNLTSDPLFVGAAGADFQVRAGSPAIDKGVNLAAQGVTTDFAGTTRPAGAAYDIGAFESAARAPAPDTTAPVITALSVSGVGQTGATIAWTTNETADTQVEYGPTAAYGKSTALNATRSTSHSAALGGLTAGTLYHYRVKSKDAAGNLATTADASFTTAVPVPSVSCVSSAGSVWANKALTPQTGAFTVEFDAVPSLAKIDGVSGLSNGAASGYASLAAAVRFNNAGFIDARNGGAYATVTSIPYAAGLNYHFRLVVNLPARTYSAFVSQGGAAEKLVGGGFAFRTEQGAVTTLSNLGVISTLGGLSVCGAVVTASGAAPAAAPVISGVSVSGVSSNGATIGWSTDKAADTQVVYGLTAAYGSATTPSSALATSHRAVLSGLAAGMLHHYQVKSRDAAGGLGTSGDFTFTTSAPPPPIACLTAAGAAKNTPLAPQTGSFTVEFSAVPGRAKMDGVAGVSNVAAVDYSSLAAAVRFNTSGYIDARNGSAYAAAAQIPYVAGGTYRFRLVVNVAARTYSSYVASGTSAERLVGAGYKFRTVATPVTSLNNLGLYTSAGSVTVCSTVVR